MRRYIAVLLLCGSGAACGGDKSPTTPSSPEPLTFILSGTVIDRSNGQALSGATVVIVDGRNATKSATTDASGHYSLSGLTASGFTARATKQYYLQNSRGVTLTTNVTQDFALDFRQPYTRSGIGDARFDFLTPEAEIWQIRIQAQYTKSSSPFVVSMEYEPAIVNEVIGTSHNTTTFEGTFNLAAGTVVIETSSGVAWSFTEIR
jgi:hypothetical protein